MENKEKKEIGDTAGNGGLDEEGDDDKERKETSTSNATAPSQVEQVEIIKQIYKGEGVEVYVAKFMKYHIVLKCMWYKRKHKTAASAAVRWNEKTRKVQILNELEIMRQLNHPHVCYLLNVVEHDEGAFLMMEYGQGGDMITYANNHPKGVSERVARQLFQQMVEGIAYLHSLNIAH